MPAIALRTPKADSRLPANSFRSALRLIPVTKTCVAISRKADIATTTLEGAIAPRPDPANHAVPPTSRLYLADFLMARALTMLNTKLSSGLAHQNLRLRGQRRPHLSSPRLLQTPTLLWWASSPPR